MSDTLSDDNEPVEQKDLFFDPDSSPSTRRGKDACAKFVELFLKAEELHTPRTRRRRVKDQEVLERQLSAILGNLVAGSVRKKPTPVAVTQSKNVLGSKQSHVVLNDKLPDVLKILASAQMLTLTLGNFEEGRLTTIEAEAEGLD